MKKNIHKNIVLSIMFFACTVLISYYFIFKYNIDKIEEKSTNIFSEQEELIKCNIYNKTNEKMKSIITVQSEKGIDIIENLNNNIIVNCNGKTIVSMDYILTKDEKIDFRITLKDGTIENIQIDANNELEKTINIKRRSDDSSTEDYKYINITFGEENTQKYYKIGKNNEQWATYTEDLYIKDYYIYKRGLNNDNNTVTIYAKTVDENNNIVEIEKEIQLNPNAINTPPTPIYYFNGTDLCENTTGGWQSELSSSMAHWTQGWASITYPTYTLTAVYRGTVACIHTKNTINLKNIDEIIFNLSVFKDGADGYIYAGITKGDISANVNFNKNEIYIFPAKNNVVSDTQIVLDVSEITGDYYIKLCTERHSGTYYTAVTGIKDIIGQ